jgi:HPt (histidine-containing phosphotransfer) domain-containing protein
MKDQEQIDRGKALQWLDGDDKMFARIKAIFKKNIPSQVDQLRGFLDAGDKASTELIAHTIMGSSAMLGASAMSDRAREIERSAIEGDMDAARLSFSVFFDEYEKVMVELTEEGGK